nr:PQQ-dependent sugar dehydrogenase [Anaerolinea sp.]
SPAGNPASVSAFPDPQGYTWTPIVSGLERLTSLVDAGDGRMLALEQPGRIRLIENGSLVAQPFLDISAKVGSQGNEQGLLGIALHPNYAENGLLYVNYTNNKGTTTIARFQASADRTQADPASEKVLLTVDQPYANHNGGSMVFGPDGYLYMGLGDGGSGGDPQGNGQKLTTLLGKILRVDVDNGDPYVIPADNPFADGQKGRAEIWAYGLRNPWRFSFDRATGDLYIGDVGQNAWEEIDYLPAVTPGGVNFGWNYREGTHPYQGEPPADLQLVDPVAEYPHPEGCSVTGGYVYRGEQLPEFNGVYLYGDSCTGRVSALLRQADGTWQNQLLFETGLFVTSFAQDRSGELYLLDQRAGAVLKLEKRGE